LRVNVPEAQGGKTVFGQLTADQLTDVGFVTAYGCDDGLPRDARGAIAKSDLNYDGRVSSVSSNRLIVKADGNGDVCFYTLRAAALIIDINGVTDTGIDTIPNRRTDTRPVPAPPTTQPPTTAPPTTQPPISTSVVSLSASSESIFTGRSVSGTIGNDFVSLRISAESSFSGRSITGDGPPTVGAVVASLFFDGLLTADS
jgi:hypothetical protein